MAGGGCALAAALTGCGREAPAPATGAGAILGASADVPVGGGTVFADQLVVVTQPSAGVFQAFSAVCTHQGCTVGEVADGLIVCPCHGSTFDAADGSVVKGPAARSLAPRELSSDGGSLRLS